MGFLDMFRSRTPAEQLRDNKRMIDRAIRDLDRERTRLEQQEKKALADMKKGARLGQKDACKIMGKDVVRIRAYITNCFKMRAQMSSVRMQIQTMESQQAMAEAMGSVTRTMRVMNRQMKLPAMQKILTDFEQQGDVIEMKQDMMEDAMQDAMGADNEEADTDTLVNQVFDEIGISFAQQLSPTPVGTTVSGGGMPVAATAAAAEEVSDADLKARLESLRRA